MKIARVSARQARIMSVVFGAPLLNINKAEVKLQQRCKERYYETETAAAAVRGQSRISCARLANELST